MENTDGIKIFNDSATGFSKKRRSPVFEGILCLPAVLHRPFLYIAGILLCLWAFGCMTSAAMPAPVTDQQSYAAWLQSTGKPLYSRYHGYAANYEVYKKYNLLTYGTPQMVPNNRYDAVAGQYAIHGYSYDEYTVTNTFFRDDSAAASNPRNWNNINLGQDAAVSWMRLTAREKEHIKSSPLFYSGKDFGGMTFSDLELGESKCVVIAVPSWTLGFALHTKHYNNKRELRYGTLHGNGIGGVRIGAGIFLSGERSDHTYTILPDREYIDLEFSVLSSIQSYIGLAKSSDIAKGGIVLNNKESESPGAGPWSSKETIRFYREYPITETDHSREITVKATVWVVSASGDLTYEELSYSFTLIEKAKVDLKGTMSMKGAISIFNGERTMMGYPLPMNPMRFLCLEKITLRIDFEGGTIPDHVVFTPIGYREVTVVPVRTSLTTAFAEIKYTMGILPSSLTWSNRRLRPPYQCSAKTFSGVRQTDFTLTGIDITGDVLDLVYLQTIAPFGTQ